MKLLRVSIIVLTLLVAGCGETSGPPDARESGSETDCRASAGSGTQATAKPEATTVETDENPELRTVTINASSGEKARVRVEIADTIAGRAIGLMYRKSLPENRGMLFVYTDEETRTYTMKNTYIPLSIAFMDSEGCIVDIQDMKPLDDDPPGYVSAEPAQYALEVNRGFFEERGIEVGDTAKLPG